MLPCVFWIERTLNCTYHVCILIEAIEKQKRGVSAVVCGKMKWNFLHNIDVLNNRIGFNSINKNSKRKQQIEKKYIPNQNKCSGTCVYKFERQIYENAFINRMMISCSIKISKNDWAFIFTVIFLFLEHIHTPHEMLWLKSHDKKLEPNWCYTGNNLLKYQ